jgi:hypothetical protein
VQDVQEYWQKRNSPSSADNRTGYRHANQVAQGLLTAREPVQERREEQTCGKKET